MFLVFNKSKIYSYIIALSMVVILFVAVAKMDDMVSPENEVVETSTNAIMTNAISTNVSTEGIENEYKTKQINHI